MKRGENLYKHGMSTSAEHRIWRSMLNRCSNPKLNPEYIAMSKDRIERDRKLAVS